MSIFRRLLGKDAPNVAAPSVPPGQRVYAIGDIHGCDALFAALIARIEADDAARGPAETSIVLLGDLIDRGPASAAVVERAMALAERRGVRLLTANHEEVMLKALDGSMDALRFFTRIGGEETIWSYGIDKIAYRDMTFEELMTAFQHVVPAAHRAFLNSAEEMVLIGDYLFVHAGIKPGVPLDDQNVSDLRWIREPFLTDRRSHGVMVVHGHTITEAVDAQANRIGIDTGAYASGRLTAIGLEGTARWFLEG
jgi:serine/threonine protein phosphatase 1